MNEKNMKLKAKYLISYKYKNLELNLKKIKIKKYFI
jgi:hypothetical protein